MTPLRILLVEDSETDARLLLAALQREDFRPTHERVDSAAGLRAALAAQVWDIIFCDYDLGGFDALAALRILQETGLDLPLIIVSGTIEEELAVAAMKSGVTDFLLKDRLGRLGPAVRQALVQRQLRQERRQTEAEQRRVFERITDGFMALDRNWRCTYLNAKGGQLLGHTPADLLGKFIWNEFPPEAGERFRPVCEKAMAEQQPASIEAHYSTFGRWLESRLYPEPTGLTVYFQDITERKKSEALLKGRRDVLEMIAQGAPLVVTLEKLLQVIETHSPEMWCSILLLDVDGQHLRHGAAPRLPEEFVRTFDGLVIGPSLGSCGTAAFRREPVVVADIATDPLWADYRDLALTHGLHACWSTPIFDAKHRVLGTFAIYYRLAGPPKGEHQELIELATHIAAVVISRQRAEEETRNLNQRLTLATAVAAIGVWDWEIAEDRWYATPTYFTMLGYQPEPGVSFREFWLKKIHPEDRAAVGAKIEAVLSGRNYSYQYEARMLHADGSYHWIKVVGRAIATDEQGKALRLIGVRIDITDFKCTEEELRTVEQQLHTLVGRLHTAREEEAKRIARELHDDLGQRLTALNMELDRLETKLPPITPGSTSQLSTMHRAVDQMIEVVQKISGELRIGHLDVLGLSAAIEWQVQDFARRSGLAAVSTRLDDGVELPEIQATALFRVMQEALTNVARHAGATRLEVSLQNAAGLVTLTIRDNGRGITSAELADRQAIGLLGMRERVQLVGGTLAIRGEAGQGTTVVVTIRTSPPSAAPV